MSIRGAESEKSVIIWPHRTATQAKFWAAACGNPYTNRPPGWENGLRLHCLAARKFCKLAGWRYPHYQPSQPQATKHGAAFLLSLTNERTDASTPCHQGCISGTAWGDIQSWTSGRPQGIPNLAGDKDCKHVIITVLISPQRKIGSNNYQQGHRKSNSVWLSWWSGKMKVSGPLGDPEGD